MPSTTLSRLTVSVQGRLSLTTADHAVRPVREVPPCKCVQCGNRTGGRYEVKRATWSAPVCPTCITLCR
jgi:hypothetical protein